MKSIRTIAACAALMTALSCAGALAPSASAEITAENSITVKSEKKSGWVTKDGKKYYYGKDGKPATGWKKIGGKKYYFGKDGVMRTGKRKIGGKSYTFDENGVLQESKAKKKKSSEPQFGMTMEEVQAAIKDKYGFILPVNETTLVAAPEFSQKNLHFYYFDSDGKMNTYGEIAETDRSASFTKNIEKQGFEKTVSPAPGFTLYSNGSQFALIYSKKADPDSKTGLSGSIWLIISPEETASLLAKGIDLQSEKDFMEYIKQFL